MIADSWFDSLPMPPDDGRIDGAWYWVYDTLGSPTDGHWQWLQVPGQVWYP